MKGEAPFPVRSGPTGVRRRYLFPVPKGNRRSSVAGVPGTVPARSGGIGPGTNRSSREEQRRSSPKLRRPAERFRISAEQVPQSVQRMIPQHPGACVAHDPAHPFPHPGTVTVNGTSAAGGFPFPERTAVEPRTGILQQSTAFRTQRRIPLSLPAIKADHPFHRPLFTSDPGTRTHISVRLSHRLPKGRKRFFFRLPGFVRTGRFRPVVFNIFVRTDVSGSFIRPARLPAFRRIFVVCFRLSVHPEPFFHFPQPPAGHSIRRAMAAHASASASAW